MLSPCGRFACPTTDALESADSNAADNATSDAAHVAKATAACQQEEGAAQEEVSGATLLRAAMLAYALMWVVSTLAQASGDA